MRRGVVIPAMCALLGACSTDQVTLSGAPTAFAGFDTFVTTGEPVALDGSLSSDPDGDVLQYRWHMESAPEGSTAEIVKPDDVVTRFTPELAGTYVVSLSVSDGHLTHRDLAAFYAERTETSTLALELELSPRVCNADFDALANSACGTADGRISIAPRAPALPAAIAASLSIEWTILRLPPGVDSAAIAASPEPGTIGALSAFSFLPPRPGEYWISARLIGPQSTSSPVLASVGVFAGGPPARLRPLAAIAARDTAKKFDRILFDSRASVVPTSSTAEVETRRWTLLVDPSHGTDTLADLATGCPMDQCRAIFPGALGVYIVTLELARGTTRGATAIHALEVRP